MVLSIFRGEPAPTPEFSEAHVPNVEWMHEEMPVEPPYIESAEYPLPQMAEVDQPVDGQPPVASRTFVEQEIEPGLFMSLDEMGVSKMAREKWSHASDELWDQTPEFMRMWGPDMIADRLPEDAVVEPFYDAANRSYDFRVKLDRRTPVETSTSEVTVYDWATDEDDDDWVEFAPANPDWRVADAPELYDQEQDAVDEPEPVVVKSEVLPRRRPSVERRELKGTPVAPEVTKTDDEVAEEMHKLAHKIFGIVEDEEEVTPQLVTVEPAGMKPSMAEVAVQALYNQAGKLIDSVFGDSEKASKTRKVAGLIGAGALIGAGVGVSIWHNKRKNRR